MRSTPGIAVALLAASLAGGCASAPAGKSDAEPPEPELLGGVSREEIEAAVPDWVAAQIEAKPDGEGALRLAAVGGEDTEVTVYLGTWCSDSRRELARLWRALDDAGGLVAFRLSYVGVNRGKDQPTDLLAGVGLEYVPTFVVRRGGRELGRIVETSPNGIEHDLAALVAGEVSGLITAKEELLEP